MRRGKYIKEGFVTTLFVDHFTNGLVLSFLQFPTTVGDFMTPLKLHNFSVGPESIS